MHISRFPRDASGFIPTYAKDIPEDAVLRVYAIGGDGIVFDCLNGLMEIKNAELAIVPYGRTNNFIRGFGKNNIASFRSIKKQINSSTIPIDVIKCGNSYALDYCVIGMEAEAVRYSERIREKLLAGGRLKRWIGRRLYAFHYFSGGLAASFDKRLVHQQYEIIIDNVKHSEYCWGFSIFNCPYYGGRWHPANDAMPNDGILDAHFIRGKRFMQTYSLLPFYVSGRHRLISNIIVPARGKKIIIRSNDILKVCMDDCVFYEDELDVEVIPGGLSFVDASRKGYRGVSND